MRQLEVGQTVTTPGRTIGEGDVNLFAGLVGDFTPIHIDETFAQTTPHGTRIAHGPHTMATAIGMATHTGLFGERVIGLVNISWDFSGAVKIGDTIHSRVTVEELRATSKPGRGLATYAFEVVNQRTETIQRGRMKVVVRTD
ncbi:MaoC/PaaZ C-terminal domain-containing protein [Tianweitania sediminis]|uniref:MaoC family dehydratase N-terminal domain-containing protein n=1 Tax=Tianweitania sediminis TaxID=1502156 RepID=A0A8J7UJM5_9HYPH|nr:MaoC/PaaZ C-terminal domain-containing protein [Tianweitania sediminis]MBP0440208.1 MaoC family dehydratase N-terminal domain-containing protein [Tianweitania sediminis]